MSFQVLYSRIPIILSSNTRKYAKKKYSTPKNMFFFQETLKIEIKIVETKNLKGKPQLVKNPIPKPSVDSPV